MSKSPTTTLTGESRFTYTKIISDALQGRIYLAHDKLLQKKVVIKEVWKNCVSLKLSRCNNNVKENFITEKLILKYLTNSKNSSNYNFAKIIDEWDDNKCYYMAIDACLGGEVFEYTKEMHSNGAMKEYTNKSMNKEQILLLKENSWIRAVKSIFIQCCKTVYWMHYKGVAHLDLSLENTMIDSKKNGTIKIIDFGLARLRDNDIDGNNNGKWICNKRVGKLGYMAPEVFEGKNYDPRKADIWSLGVMLWMMLIGSPPYETPTEKDSVFKFIINGRMMDVLKYWKRVRHMTIDSYELLMNIFKLENNRITMDGILDSKFLNLKQWRLDFIKNENKLKKNININNNEDDNNDDIKDNDNDIEIEEYSEVNDENTDYDSDEEQRQFIEQLADEISQENINEKSLSD